MAVRRHTPLLEDHRRLGAKLTTFAGWEMPLQYDGIIAEHTAVRTGTGVFDVSHLGKLHLEGPTAEPALQDALTADVAAVEPGRASYSLALTDDGGCIDDVFVYRLGAAEWLVVPNAANVDPVAAAIRESGGRPHDDWDRWAILAIQGPGSFALTEELWRGSKATELRLHSFGGLDFHGEQGIVARTGYTGESGFELYVPSAVAPRVFGEIIEAGAKPVGLGARDTLRLEMGYALYGHELSLDINPLEAGLGWTLAWNTPFRGRAALEKVKEAGSDRILVGIECKVRGVPRQGYPVLTGNDVVGEVTSGNYSPTLGTGIALALCPRDRAPVEGTRVDVDARGRLIEGVIVTPPFVARGRKAKKS